MIKILSKITIGHLAVISAIFLSCVSAYFSVTGMALLFSGSSIAVMIMASSLEFSKIVSAAWLQHNWNNAPRFIKLYLVCATFVLILLTSMGTFGYLSKAHLLATESIQVSQLQIQPLEYQINLEERKLKNAQTSLDTLDRLVLSSDQKDALLIRQRQARERKVLGDEINLSIGQIQSINAKLIPYKEVSQRGQDEVGPLKYIAEMIYGKDAPNHFDESVRIVITFIVIVFDPLAIVLLLAGTSSIKNDVGQPEIKRGRGRPKKDKMVMIPENSIMKFVMKD